LWQLGWSTKDWACRISLGESKLFCTLSSLQKTNIKMAKAHLPNCRPWAKSIMY
jgi:hypothetical protein